MSPGSTIARFQVTSQSPGWSEMLKLVTFRGERLGKSTHWSICSWSVASGSAIIH